MAETILPCFVRKPRGLDIYAACGQLKSISQPAAEPDQRLPVLL